MKAIITFVFLFSLQNAWSFSLDDYKTSAVTTYGYGKNWSGTAWYISENEAITAKHVCDNDALFLGDESLIEYKYVSPTTDLCYIRVFSFKKHKVFTISERDVNLGDKVCARGWWKYGFIFTCGVVDGIMDFPKTPYWEFAQTTKISTCMSKGGMSGGPVVNMQNKVVGVTTLGFDLDHKHGFIPLKDLNKFIRKAVHAYSKRKTEGS